MSNDPIADLLTRIRNAGERRRDVCEVPSTKMLVSVVDILKTEGYITDYNVDRVEGDIQDTIFISLKYDENEDHFIKKLERVSKPGLRSYRSYTDIPKVLNGLGIGIFSTPKGVMTGKNAISEKVGGEFLCKIW